MNVFNLKMVGIVPYSPRLLLLVIYTVTVLQIVTGIPPPYESNGNCPDCISRAENTANHHRVRRRAASGYKYMYVTQCGIHRDKPGHENIEIAATLEASDAALDKAARLTYLMLRFMPKKLFSRLAKKGRIGVFAVDQVVGDFPEYASTKDSAACKDSCSGRCRSTCASDGRKYDNLVGYSKARAVVREDTLMCSETDPFKGKLNVLMHEFAHSIHLNVVGRDHERSLLLEDSYETFDQRWAADDAYATSDVKEYFAEATTSYFRTSLLGKESAWMNLCGDPANKTLCADEFSSRENLKSKDPVLFGLVNGLYSGERPFLEGRVGVCDCSGQTLKAGGKTHNSGRDWVSSSITSGHSYSETKLGHNKRPFSENPGRFR